MAQYYLQLNRYVGNPDFNLFVGPYEKKNQAELTVDDALSKNIEVYYDDAKPADPNTGIRAQIVTGTVARKSPYFAENKVLDHIPTVMEWDGYVPAEIEQPESETVLEASESKKKASTPRPANKPASKTFTPKGNIFNGKRRIVIVTRYPSTAQWLQQHGIEGEVVDRVRNESQIADAIVVGVLPYRLAAKTAIIGSVDMPGLMADQRGTPLTVEDMDRAKATLRWYSIKEVKPEDL